MAKKGAFIGFEVWYNNMRMSMKMQMYFLYICIAVQLICCAVIYTKVLDKSKKSIIQNYVIAKVGDSKARQKVYIKDRYVVVTKKHMLDNYKPYVNKYLSEYYSYAKYTFFSYTLIFLLNFFFAWKSRRQTATKYIRGAKLITPKEMNKLHKKNKMETYLSIGDVKMPVKWEALHTMFSGRIGSGKTVGISDVLEKILERGDKCIVHDFKGDFVPKFYRPGIDYIFNILDSRNCIWNFFDEINDPMDIDAIGHSMIPNGKSAGGLDPFWNNAARDVFTGIINFMVRNGLCEYKELYNYLTSSSTEICKLLKNTPGSEAGRTAIADPESKQTGSILSVMTQFTKIFAYMKDIDEIESKTIKFKISDYKDKNFQTDYNRIVKEIEAQVKYHEEVNAGFINSPQNWTRKNIRKDGGELVIQINIKHKRLNLKEWVNDPDAGNIYVTNYPKLQNTLAPLISLMFDLVGRHILSLSEDLKRRTFAIIDELGMLQRIPSIITLLTQGRSKGFCAVMGIQDFSQLDTIYSREQRNTIVNACNSKIILAASGETAEEFSKMIGDTEIEEPNLTVSMGIKDNRDGLSLNRNRVVRRLVLASEISTLSDLHCYVKFPGTPYTKTELTWKEYSNNHKPFMIREGLSFEELLRNEVELSKPFIPEINPVIAGTTKKLPVQETSKINLEEEVVNIGGDDEWQEN